MTTFLLFNSLNLLNYWFFILNNKYTHISNHFLIQKNTDLSKSSTIIKKLKKRLCYFLILSENTSKLHWAYKSLLVKKTFNFNYTHSFNINFFLKQVTVLMNLFITFLSKNYNFFVFNFDFLINDVYSFSKWVYGVKNAVKYDFIFKTDLKKFRNFKWKKRFNMLIKKKKVKIAFLLDTTNNEFFIDFLKNSKIITVGLVPQNISFFKLDFWLITNTNSYIIKYLFFSYIYSIYNIVLLQKFNRFYLYYNKSFTKVLLSTN